MDGLFEQFDLFLVYRRVLLIFVGVYSAIRLGQNAIRCVHFLYRPSRSSELMRHYVSVLILRVRWRRFWPDYLHIGMLGGALLLVVYIHHFWMG